jgi:hypothetical protein
VATLVVVAVILKRAMDVSKYRDSEAPGDVPGAGR